MSGLICYLWWFLAGLLLGWLLHWLLGRGLQKHLDQASPKPQFPAVSEHADVSGGSYDAGFEAGVASMKSTLNVNQVAQTTQVTPSNLGSLSPALMALALAARTKDGRDDLTIVEGIGPKINDLLISGGIDTFEKLASAPTEVIKKLLDDAGARFRLANPSSWAKQARLCADGQWEALHALQEALTAGVDKSADAGHSKGE